MDLDEITNDSNSDILRLQPRAESEPEDPYENTKNDSLSESDSDSDSDSESDGYSYHYHDDYDYDLHGDSDSDGDGESELESDSDSEGNGNSVARRVVEGDCGICYCALRKVQNDFDHEADNDDCDDGGGHDRRPEQLNEHSNKEREDEDEDSEEDDGLVWCKAKCGVNYHRDCIDQWLRVSGRYTSCPTCRTKWKYSKF